MNESQLDRLQQSLGIVFRDPKLLEQAFTHSSYVNEHKNARHNERLEYLGDAVLQLAVSEYLYRRYPRLPEGELTQMRAAVVCEPSLHEASRELHFGDHLLLGRGEELTGGRERPAILADVFEAFVGALYLDQGYEAAVRFLEQHLFPKIKRRQRLDAKSFLQQTLQQASQGDPVYRLVEELGSGHDKRFVSEVLVGGKRLGTGTGRTKKEAEQKAAEEALQRLDIRR
jgi:ribonuclease-3